MSKLLSRKLQEFTGKRVSVSIEGNEGFKGTLVDFDSEVLVLKDVSHFMDYDGKKVKELVISLTNILWIVLED